MSLTVFSQSYGYELTDQHYQIKSYKILQESVYVYNLKNNGTSDSTLVFKTIYDEFGNSVEEYLPNPERKKADILRYSNFYTANGFLLKRIEYSKDTSLIGTTEFVYDSTGHIIRIYKFNANKTEHYTEQKIYNKDGQIAVLKKVQFSKDRIVLDQLIKYYYNQDNDLLKEETVDSHGKVINSLNYQYDKVLNKKSVYSLKNGIQKFEGEYLYNNSQQVITFNSSFFVSSMPSNTYYAVDAVNINEKMSSANTIYLDPTVSKQQNGSNIITGIKISSRENNNTSTINSPLSNDTYHLVKNNIYNTDNTISETTITIDGKRVRYFKHFYSRS